MHGNRVNIDLTHIEMKYSVPRDLLDTNYGGSQRLGWCPKKFPTGKCVSSIFSLSIRSAGTM